MRLEYFMEVLYFTANVKLVCKGEELFSGSIINPGVFKYKSYIVDVVFPVGYDSVEMIVSEPKGG